MKRRMNFAGLIALILLTAIGCEKDKKTCQEKANELTINQLQILGSHNSYRKHTYEPIFQFLFDPPVPLPDGFEPEDWDYGHLTLEDQFDDYGIRSIELDVYYDPAGGTYANRWGNVFVGEDPASGEPALDEPGLKVLHFPDFDYMTHYLTFKDALQTVKDWSDANPNHLPLMIMVEPKEDNPNAMLPGWGLTETPPFDKTALESIDTEIKAVFGENLDKVITPDDVRDTYATLNDAILDKNWPTLGESRGKVLFVMLASGNEAADYSDGFPSLEGRVMFVFSTEGEDMAAFININNPTDNLAEIQNLVGQGYIVRTRADADTREARTGDTSRREAAFESGAQIISTDYYKPNNEWTDYFVQFPYGYLALNNPINGKGEMDCEIME